MSTVLQELCKELSNGLVDVSSDEEAGGKASQRSRCAFCSTVIGVIYQHGSNNLKTSIIYV